MRLVMHFYPILPLVPALFFIWH